MRCDLIRYRNQERFSAWRRFMTTLSGCLLAAVTCSALAQELKPIVVGRMQNDAEKYLVEYLRYDRTVPLYKEYGLQPTMINGGDLVHGGLPQEELCRVMKTCHVVIIGTTQEGVYKLTPELEQCAAELGRKLARYVEDGGGLLIQANPVRYPGSDDEKYWNIVFKPFGVKILNEGLFDKTRTFQPTPGSRPTYWETTSFTAHPVTEGVKRLFLPKEGFGFSSLPGVVAMEYSSDWQVIVKGGIEAKSYQTVILSEYAMDIDKEGSYKSEPPILAVRSFGKGRIASYPLNGMHTGPNYTNPLWKNVVESAGDTEHNRPSDGWKLLMNCCKWLGQPAATIADFGTFRPEPYKPATFPPTAEFDTYKFQEVTPDLTGKAADPWGVRGIMGAHSAYSDGQGTVADYVKAAKEAGLGFIVFNDPLELLTPEKLEALKKDCEAASEFKKFYACPGIEFTDGIGNRWAFWGEKVVWPVADFVDGKYKYQQWTGKQVLNYGKYIHECSFCPSALLDYKQLRANGGHPENMGWFYDVFPLVYDRDKLVADNYQEWLASLRDLRMTSVASFTRIRSPADVKLAADTFATSFTNVECAQRTLNSRCSTYRDAMFFKRHATQGPRILLWYTPNNQMECDWMVTRGVQRVRLKFVVRSENGIADVKVHDADQGVFRRFLGHGAKELAREFEVVHDRQRSLTLEVTDLQGKRAFSHYLWLFCLKQGLTRCGDNSNILGPLGFDWGPQNLAMFNIAKNWQNTKEFTLVGFDSSRGICPQPNVLSRDDISFTPVSDYPHPSREKACLGRVMNDVKLAGHNLQIATMTMNKLAQIPWETEEKAQPAYSSILKDIGENEYFERVHTMYAPKDRCNFFITWNYRREREGTQDYRGSLVWHTGEIRFKKDATLAGSIPIPLVRMECPIDLAKKMGDTVVVTDQDKGFQVYRINDLSKPDRITGRIQPGGYIAQMPTPVGYHAFLAPNDTDFTYNQQGGRIEVGFGKNGQKVKAGEVLKYRFAFGAFADNKGGNQLVEQTARGLNLDGGIKGYPIAMKVGTVVNAMFFFTAEAANQEAVFTLGPQDLIIELPIMVKGLEDNGCAAVYSGLRPWFRFVPVVDGAAVFQYPIEKADELWAGNIFAADKKDIKLTLIMDGQAPGKSPFLEVHNPTDKDIETTLRSPKNTPVFGGMSSSVKVPAGDSVRLQIEGKAFRSIETAAVESQKP